ncbi:Hypothetical protein (Fragment) [Durusdinium trenchii]
MTATICLQEQLSLVLVTSPVPSNPSTELLEHVLNSFFAAYQGLAECDAWVVSDGFRVAEPAQRPKPKAGRIAEGMVAPYEEFRSRLDALAHVRHVRAPEHKGFAGCLHIALRKVFTPYVLVLQHDRPCLRAIDATSLLEAMEHFGVKYLGLPTKASLARTSEEYLASSWRIRPEVLQLKDTSDRVLRPLLFWYDSAHICSVEHYKDLVFRKGREWSGGFIEDSFGQEMQIALRQASSTGTWREVHQIYSTYLYDDGCGPIIGHLDGRRYRPETGRTLMEVEKRKLTGWMPSFT